MGVAWQGRRWWAQPALETIVKVVRSLDAKAGDLVNELLVWQ